ncbi:MAG: pyruvate kinase [Syntrophobacteraceae bacterium]|nr:pyruvate kinase [Syntrophobacteraceae bacterium]
MTSKAKLRKTKIVCTIGPASGSSEMIEKLISEGMDVARLNFSHGNREEHRKTIHAIRSISRKVGKEIGILQDLGGPKIRLGQLGDGKIVLKHGDRVRLVAGEYGKGDVIPVNYPSLLDDIEEGNPILLADGTVQFTVIEKKRDEAVCEVDVGGIIYSRKGVNLPWSRLSVRAFTDKDRDDLVVGMEEKVDFVALSFIRSLEDIEEPRKIISSAESPPMLIAKIEKREAVENFDQILSAVDAVMVARGDLGVEMPLEEAPITQKKIIRITRQAGKPVITATQMLGSMVDRPRPTRAEATDVANAILDGTDALMLSDETAMGLYPAESVATLDRIARATEPYMEESGYLKEEISSMLHTVAAGISRAAVLLAIDLKAAAIFASSSSGNTARLVARFRPSAPVVALTDHIETQRQLSLSWGVIPHLVAAFVDTDQMFSTARALAMEKQVAGSGDSIVITAGVPVGTSGTTNLLKVMEIN